MEPPKYQRLVRTVALAIVTLGLASLIHFHTDPDALSKIDSMSASDYGAYARHIHDHSYVYHFVVLLVSGWFYLGAIDFVQYLLRLITDRKPSNA